MEPTREEIRKQLENEAIIFSFDEKGKGDLVDAEDMIDERLRALRAESSLSEMRERVRVYINAVDRAAVNLEILGEKFRFAFEDATRMERNAVMDLLKHSPTNQLNKEKRDRNEDVFDPNEGDR